MFVLKNAWAALGRVKWRTALIALLALLVSFSAAVDLAVIRADDTANNETYQSQKATAVIRPNAQTQAKRDGADSSYTDKYLTWEKYSTYATAAQSNNVTFNYTLATSVPVRESKSLQAIAAKNDTSEDKTGGNLTLQAFYTLDAAKINDYGYYKVVKGKHLSYKTQSDGVLISQALADKNNLKVGDKVTVGNPSKASETYTFTVRGIYEYDSDVPEGNGSDAKYAKDNRENVIYTTYLNFAKNGLDTTEATGWAIPNLNIIFSLANPSTYNTFVRLVKKAKLDTKTYEITSPSLTAYKKSIEPLDSAASAARIVLLAVTIVGGIALLALIVWAAVGGRRDEIGMAMAEPDAEAQAGLVWPAQDPTIGPCQRVRPERALADIQRNVGRLVHDRLHLHADIDSELKNKWNKVFPCRSAIQQTSRSINKQPSIGQRILPIQFLKELQLSHKRHSFIAMIVEHTPIVF